MRPKQRNSAAPNGEGTEKMSERNRRLRAAGIAALAWAGLAAVWCVLVPGGAAELPQGVPGTLRSLLVLPLAEELGGTGGITMAAISITGIFGNILGPQVLRWFHVTDPVAQGVAMGCGSHAFGTVRALEMGEVEGAMGSLSLVITALLTVVIAPFLGNLI